jgi:predicted  nucleic acid-binding Zn-ribbon protein
MNDALKNLYDLQEIDSRILAAKRALAALDSGAGTKEQASKTEAELHQASDQLRTLEAEMKDCELNLKSLETKKGNYTRRMYAGEVTSPKELESMEKEIAMLDRNSDKLETRILELMDLVQEQRQVVSRVGSRLDQLKTELAAKIEAFNSKSQELNSEISKADAERVVVVETVDEIMLRRYESLRARMNGVALAKVENDRCGVCHVALTPYSVRILKEAEEPSLCESCGRILFLPE